MDEIILEMKLVSKAFAGVRALKNVSFTLHANESHALLGENGAGKSTLMKVLLGLHSRDEGEINLMGEEVIFKNPAEALKHGISMIHQEISLVPDMSVAENIWLGRENTFRHRGLINEKKRNDATKTLLNQLEIDIDPIIKVRNLSMSSMQLIELARAVSYNARIIIMDEPTSALTSKEIELLYRIVRRLNEKGTSVIFITHKLEEVLAICSKYTVLRDGENVAKGNCAEVTQSDLIKMIAGRDLSALYEKKESRIGETILEVKNFNCDNVFSDVNFCVRKGEILGFAGLMGAGRSEIMRALFGIDKFTSGQIFFEDKEVIIRQPQDAIQMGIGMITEDRMLTGSIYTMSVMNNATVAALDIIANKVGIFNRKDEMKAFLDHAQSLKVKYNSPDELMSNLSGGNQQKVIFSRWLLRNIKVLIMDEPTRGIDVGAKFEIYKLIEDLARMGTAVILVSSEMRELLALSDRIMVVREGSITFETDSEHADQETIVARAFGY